MIHSPINLFRASHNPFKGIPVYNSVEENNCFYGLVNALSQYVDHKPHSEVPQIKGNLPFSLRTLSFAFPF